jgi:hypothetical protein
VTKIANVSLPAVRPLRVTHLPLTGQSILNERSFPVTVNSVAVNRRGAVNTAHIRADVSGVVAEPPNALHIQSPPGAAWSTINAAEAVPGVMTPLTASAWGPACEMCIRETRLLELPIALSRCPNAPAAVGRCRLADIRR